MEIKLKRVKLREIMQGFKEHIENGVYGMSGALDIRPAFQREFVYDDKKRDKVINTIRLNRPLGIFYFVVSNLDRTKLEVLDGQQRLIAACRYIHGKYSVDHQFFHNLTQEEQDAILDYEIMAHYCEGTDREKLEWFNTINTAGEPVNDQELRNSVYTGPWLSDAKFMFSKTSCSAYRIGKDYMTGTPIKQDYLKQVLSWINKGDIETYMASHQSDENAQELWEFFDNTMSWVKKTFPVTRGIMKGLKWGELYLEYGDKKLNPLELEEGIKKLLEDEDVTNKKGIYYYLLTGDTKPLSIRKFNDTIRYKVFSKQKGLCPHCRGVYTVEEMEADHITPWSEGGKTIEDNCQMLCKKCNRKKSSN